MADFKKRDFGGGNRSGGFGGNGGGGFSGGRSKFGRPGNREFRQSQMYSATCAQCGKPCEVPFRPTGERPVYCSYCFKNQGAPANRENSFSSGPSHVPTRDFNSVPGAKPGESGLMYDLKKQVDAVNIKLDKILEIMKRNGGGAHFEDKNAVNENATKMSVKPEEKPKSEISLKKVIEKASKKKTASKKK